MQVWHNIMRACVLLAVWLCLIGQSVLAQHTGNDQRPGSVLFYNIYTSRSSNPAAVNTLVTITNASPSTDINVHLFFVDAATCQTADSYILLTRNQTARFLTSEIDPDINGYIIAVAVDRDGVPTQHNFLLGDMMVKQTLGPTTGTTHSYQLNAIAFAKMNALTPPVSPDGILADLVFDGGASAASYEPLPSELAIDNFESPATADTRMVIYSPRAKLFGDSPVGGRLFVIYYDDAENAFSGMAGLVCWLQSRLTIIRNLSLRVGAGRTGWARITGYRDDARIPLLGSVVTASAFVGGHNMHHLSAFPSYTITIPVFPPKG
jgi:hypothetical protein